MESDRQSPQWFNGILFPEVFRTFRLAMQPVKLIIAFMMIAVICLAGWLMDFSRTVVATPDTQYAVTELHTYLADPAQCERYVEAFEESGARTGVFSTLWRFTATRYHSVLRSLFDLDFPAVAADIEDCVKALGWAVRRHTLYCVVFFIIAHAAFSVAGGAICRISALQFAQGEKPGLTEAMRFGLKKFPSLLAAPLVPVGTIAGAGLFIVLLGLLGNIPRAGEIIVAAFLLFALVAGAFIAFVAIGAVAGFNLMFPAIAYDGLDCYDAISRTFNYVYARPWRMGFYTALAALYGSVCYVFVRLFTFLLIWLTRAFLGIGIWARDGSGISKLAMIWPEPRFGSLFGGPVPTPLEWSEMVAAALIYLFLLVVAGTMVSFIVSFYFSGNTIIYALMRQKVDHTPIENVSRPSIEYPNDAVFIHPSTNGSKQQ